MDEQSLKQLGTSAVAGIAGRQMNMTMAHLRDSNSVCILEIYFRRPFLKEGSCKAADVCVGLLSPRLLPTKAHKPNLPEAAGFKPPFTPSPVCDKQVPPREGQELELTPMCCNNHAPFGAFNGKWDLILTVHPGMTAIGSRFDPYTS